MQCPGFPSVLSALPLTLTAPIPACVAVPRSLAGSYTDVDTGIKLHGHIHETSFVFGMVMPEEPATDFIVQIVSPLGQDGGGWGGVSFGPQMIGPLMLVTWPNDDKVMTVARIANNYTTSGVAPYTANPITLSPIRQGTFVNNTHVTSTFPCRGCINSDTFGPASENPEVVVSYAYSNIAAEDPSNISTSLSDHTGIGGEYSVFKVDLEDTKTADYDNYASMAEGDGDGDVPEQSSADPTSTQTPTSTTTPATVTATDTDDDWRKGCYKSECEMPSGSDFSHREMPRGGVVALMLLGAAYLGQLFLH